MANPIPPQFIKNKGVANFGGPPAPAAAPAAKPSPSSSSNKTYGQKPPIPSNNKSNPWQATRDKEKALEAAIAATTDPAKKAALRKEELRLEAILKRLRRPKGV